MGKQMTQARVIEEMPPDAKLRAALRLYWSARSLKAAALRGRHPDWTDACVEAAVREAFLFHRG